MAYRLKRKETVAEGVRRIAREEIDAALGPSDGSGPVAERVHAARTSCKKLRGLLRLVRPNLGDVYAAENKFVRDAARQLSVARDADVVLAGFESLARKGMRHIPAESLACVRAELRSSVAGTSPAESIPERLAAFAGGFRELRARVEAWPIDGCGFRLLEDGLEEVYSDGRDAMRSALRSDDPADRHEWRKQAKYHWYHVRLLRDVWRPVIEAAQGELERLADILGDDHDLTVLREAVVGLTGCEPMHVEAFVALLDRRAAKLQCEAESLGARIYAEKPKALVRRMSRYWKAWRGKS